MKLSEAYIIDWVRHYAWDGNMKGNHLATGPNGNAVSLTVDQGGVLTAVRADKDGQLKPWAFSAGSWHGSPVVEVKR